MPEQGKKQRIYSVATYDKRIKAAQEKGRELVAKRKALIASRDRVENIAKLLGQRQQLAKSKDKKRLAAFDAKNASYLGKNPKPLKEVQSLHRKLLSRVRITRKSIANMKARLDRLRAERKTSVNRNAQK